MDRIRRDIPALAPALTLSLALLVTALAGAQDSEPQPRPLRFPDIHHDFVVFSYAGDIWRAPTQGGEARRLTVHEGLEVFPKISPDGQWVAFSGEYSGTRQVFLVPSQGGTPKQLTFYADVGVMAPRGGWDYWVQGWTPDGKILVRCNRTPWGNRMGRYCVVDPAGGLETYLPLPEGGGASFSPDGNRLAYTPISREFRTWKRTQGGRAQDVWIYDLEAKKSTRLTTDNGTDNFPMWSGDTVYFTSDRRDTLNLFASDTAQGGAPRQVTKNDTWDVLWPALGPKSIVYTSGGHLWRFDLATEQTRRIPIEFHTDLPVGVPQFRDVSENLAAASLSPSGQRVAFEARGELFSVPRKNGETRNLTRSQGIREKDPTWSPDGKWIAFFSDASGEYELYVRAPGAVAEARQLTSGSDVWAGNPVWSPDSKRIAWGDQKHRLRFIDVASGDITDVATGKQGNINAYGWSPDSRWLTYQGQHDSQMPGIAVYSIDDKKTQMLGDGLTADTNPVWSADGKYIFFLSNRDYNLAFSAFEFDFVHENATRVYAASLDPDAAPLFPFKSDEEEGSDDEEDEDNSEDADSSEDADKAKDSGKKGKGKKNKKDQKDEDKDDKEAPALRVVAEGFVDRTLALPGLPPANYFGLTAVKGALFYVRLDDTGPSLIRFELEQAKEDITIPGTFGYEVTPDGSKMLYNFAGSWNIADVQPGLQPGEGALDTSGLSLKLDLRAEWKQMYNEAWRIYRDFFYDPKMHGFDWRALGDRYATLVPGIGHRSELDFIFGELIGELEAGHAYAQSGDEPRVDRIEGGLLGCELELDAEAGLYRIARIYRGENWDDDYRSPLTEPGVHVKQGEYLLAIDGEDLRYPDNPYRLLENKAERQVVLKVSAEADMAEARDVTVRPIASELNLMYIDWVKSRMDLVNRLSGGKIGYIHLPNTATEGNRMVQKLFFSQAEKAALILDDRYNGGGFIPDTMIEYFKRTPMSYWARREATSTRTPGFAHLGPKVMLINGYSSSGGDALPYYFRQAGLGKLIGTRTWGGLIGISGAPPLADGGVVLPPTFRFYDNNGEWAVENEGVSPDIEVFDLPEERLDGGDPSIEKAVEVLLDELEKNTVQRPEVPTPPDLSN